jgi:hypothetical protein
MRNDEITRQVTQRFHPHHLRICSVGHVYTRENEDRRKTRLPDKLEKRVDERLLSRLRENSVRRSEAYMHCTNAEHVPPIRATAVE